MRWIVTLLAVLIAVSSTYAIGMYVPEGLASTMNVNVGESKEFVFTVKNDGAQKLVNMYAKSPTSFVNVTPDITMNMGPYDQRDVRVVITGNANGTTVVKYGFKDMTASSGFGMQLVTENEVKVVVGSGVNSSSGEPVVEERRVRYGSGGGGGGGGSSSMTTNKTPSCYGKYVLENKKWVCVPNKNVTVAAVEPVVPQVEQGNGGVQEGIVADVSAGDGGIAQGVVDVATGSVGAVVEAVEEVAPKIIPAVAKNWHIAIIILAGVLMASSLAVVMMMRGGSYA